MTVNNQTAEAKTLWSDLDVFYSKVEEEVLNPVGYIPVLGSLTGSLRATMGIFQCTLSGLGVFVESLLGAFSSDRANSIRHYDGMGAAYEHNVHGILNIVRGAIEFVPCLPLVTCLPLDRWGFKYHYRSTLINCKIVPLNSNDNLNQSLELGLSKSKINFEKV